MTLSNSVPGDLEKLLLDPTSSFRQPEDVLGRADLGVHEKAEILCRWAYDATELAVAEEEGMSGGESADLSRIIRALDTVTGGFDTEHTAPTKHAGFCVL